jgi:hypothetical protein
MAEPSTTSLSEQGIDYCLLLLTRPVVMGRRLERREGTPLVDKPDAGATGWAHTPAVVTACS